jgi:hypothetical protein
MNAKASAAAPLLEGEQHPHTHVQSGVKEVVMMPASDASTGVEMFERLARDPNASVEKIERLMALWERAEGRKAEAQFNSAMSAAQKEMRSVAADAWNPQTKSRYASYEALDRDVRPVYARHGFGLSFDTGDAPQPDQVRVLAYVTHDAGHARTYRLDMPADGKGAKGGDVMTKTHATGAAMTYGMRYLLKMIFNIAVGEGDDDGNGAAGKPPTPAGFDDWWIDMQAVADEGTAAIEKAWTASKADFKTYVVTNLKAEWNAIKAKAGKARK